MSEGVEGIPADEWHGFLRSDRPMAMVLDLTSVTTGQVDEAQVYNTAAVLDMIAYRAINFTFPG